MGRQNHQPDEFPPAKGYIGLDDEGEADADILLTGRRCTYDVKHELTNISHIHFYVTHICVSMAYGYNLS